MPTLLSLEFSHDVFCTTLPLTSWGRMSSDSPVAQLVERLTVNDAATYGGAVDVSRMAELIPSSEGARD